MVKGVHLANTYQCFVKCPKCNYLFEEEISKTVYTDGNGTVYDEQSKDDSPVEDDLYDYTNVNPSNDSGSFTSVNQGKGDCSIVVIGKCVIIYDFGLKNQWPNLQATLYNLKIPKNELLTFFLVISHDDLDHTGNLQNVVSFLNREYISKVIIISGLSEDDPLFDFEEYVESFISLDSQKILKFKLTSSILLEVHFPQEHFKDNNRNSLVALIGKNEEIVMLTGDQHQSEIDIVRRTRNINQTSIQLVPHHGSIHNFDGVLPLLPSKYYIVSGTPLYDKNGGQNFFYNQRCQTDLITNLIKQNISTTLILTKDRLTARISEMVILYNIQIIIVDTFFTIPLFEDNEEKT